MNLFRSPVRVSLFGGGTDYIEYIQTHGEGICIGFAIDKHHYIQSRILPPYFQHKSRLVYSKIECVQDNSHIEHRAIKNAIDVLIINNMPLEIIHSSDVPSFAGLGSSSSFLVSTILSLNQLQDYPLTLDENDLINMSVYIEKDLMGGNVGFQDTAFATFGGCYEFIFTINNSLPFPCVNTDAIHYPRSVKDSFEKYGLLFFTNISRNSSDVVGKYINNIANSKNIKEIFNIAKEADYTLRRSDFDLEKISHLLNRTWLEKRGVSAYISIEKVDCLRTGVLARGALAMKLLGGGGGGSIFILADPKYHEEIIKFCKDEGCIHIPYSISQKAERIL